VHLGSAWIGSGDHQFVPGGCFACKVVNGNSHDHGEDHTRVQRGILHEHGQKPAFSNRHGGGVPGSRIAPWTGRHVINQREGDEVEQHCAEDLVDVELVQQPG